MLYLVSTNVGFLMVVNFLGGVVWAGLSLGLQNYVFDSVKPEERAKAIALYSTINAVGWSVGALLGSWLVEPSARIEWQESSSFTFLSFSGVLALVSSSLRRLPGAQGKRSSPTTFGIAARETLLVVVWTPNRIGVPAAMGTGGEGALLFFLSF
jgi:predicted MFS family arabinose efflux permease